jgi:hypothetical protein
MATKFWTTSNGDQNIKTADIADATATGKSLMQAEDAAAAAAVVAPQIPGRLSSAAMTAIAALTSESTAADIVAALQAS